MRSLAVTIEPKQGEALDGFLERVARANGLDHMTFFKLLGPEIGSYARLAIAPPGELLRRTEHLCGLTTGFLELLTLRSLPGLDLAEADAGNRKTWRNRTTLGWSPTAGTAICPWCFSEDGLWRLIWRHPWVTVCLTHRVFLVGRCPSCQRPFRSQRTPITPDGDPWVCHNYSRAAHGQCGQLLADVPVEFVAQDRIAAQGRIQTAVAGNPVLVLGEPTAPDAYLRELWATTVLLLRLVMNPNGEYQAEWEDRARPDGLRTGGRTARWRSRPPGDYRMRTTALTVADQVLSSASIQLAAEALRPWLSLAPRSAGRGTTFLTLNTTPTPMLTDIVAATRATEEVRVRLVDLIDDHGPTTSDPGLIPQLIDEPLYLRLFGDAFDVTPRVGRGFISLCVARRIAGASSWDEAATLVGADPRTVAAANRTAETALLWRPERIALAIDEVAVHLVEHPVDYRRREAVVRALNDAPGWFTQWRLACASGTHASSRHWATTWLWTEWAQGSLATSPAWTGPTESVITAHFRAFEQRLTPKARRALIDIATAYEQEMS